MRCFECGRPLAAEDAVFCDSSVVEDLRFYACWRCFQGLCFEGGAWAFDVAWSVAERVGRRAAARPVAA